MVSAFGVGSLQPALSAATPGACDSAAVYWDYGVIGQPGDGGLSPISSLLTGTNPRFASAYCNTARSMRLIAEVTTLQTAPALDEGGNWIDVRFGPITLTKADGSFFGNYHIQNGSPAINNGAGPSPGTDYDGQTRVAPADIGADELILPVPLWP
jgi:hypothetical protein